MGDWQIDVNQVNWRHEGKFDHTVLRCAPQKLKKGSLAGRRLPTLEIEISTGEAAGWQIANLSVSEYSRIFMFNTAMISVGSVDVYLLGFQKRCLR